MPNKLIISQRAGNSPEYNGPEYNSNQISLVNTNTISEILRGTTRFEFHIYDKQGISPFNSDYQYLNYNILSNDSTISSIEINPRKDIEEMDMLLSFQNFTLVYNFFNNLCGTDDTNQLFIDSISSDRTELILKGSFTNNTNFTNNTLDYINYRESAPDFRDFYLNLGDNTLLLGTNIQIDDSNDNNPLIFIKLYEPLPDSIERLQNLWIVQKIADTLVYDGEYLIEPTIDESVEFLSGPNINITLGDEVNSSTPFFTKTELLPTSSFFLNQINTLLSESDLNINVDYNNYKEFINFSSPTIRLQNFYYKISLLEEYESELSSLTGIDNNSGSVNLFQSRINEILQNFDGYDKFLYYESGSKSWPKTNTNYPFTLASTGSSEGLTWLGSLDTNSIYYGGQLLSASNYDENNRNYLLNSIPSYLRDDSQNAPYETFVSMIGQHFDNIWIYTKDITNKFNGDNRINFGISRDLVSDAIKEFGIKLYQNNFSNSDLVKSFFGFSGDFNANDVLIYGLGTWGGSLYGPGLGEEALFAPISASNDIIPIDDINKRIYKRIYHNSPFLLKSKGTKTGLQALINCFGVPDSILQINEFGGKDKVRENDWDFYRRIYNKELIATGSGNHITTVFANPGGSNGLNPKWDVDPIVPRTVEFRFKSRTNPDTLPNCTNLTNTPIREELFILKDDAIPNFNISSSLAITLEYFGSGSVTSSYSGSTFDSNNQYADLTLYVSGSTQYYSSSINLPFYNKDWWNVMLQYDSGSNTFNLNTGNKIYIGNDGTKLGFTGSTSITVPAYNDTSGYRNASLMNSGQGGTNRFFGTGRSGSIKFSGSLQEIRYWTNLLSESAFNNHIMNPLSIETGYLTGSLSPVETLAFRTREGEDWSLTGSATSFDYLSIHPKITGSFTPTSSFVSRGNPRNTYSVAGLYQGNREFQFLNQPIAGIKNRINDKIRVENLEFPEGDTLTYYRPLQQNNEASQSFTDHTNYIEVGFSPSNQVNDDIIAQLGQLNIGEYIGDPRQRSSSLDYYEDLNNLRDEYFEKYIKNYNLNDFIRLIKYFDNSLFKMIKDFVPLRNSTATGIIIKQHLLERNKYPQPRVNKFTTVAITPNTGSTINEATQVGNNSELIFEDITITGSIKSQIRGFITGSPIQVFSGGTGGSFDRFNNIDLHPYGPSGSGPTNRFGITQSFSESVTYLSGSIQSLISNQDEFYNGEFSGSSIVVTTQSLNLGELAFDFANELAVEDFRLNRYVFVSSVTPLSTFLKETNRPGDSNILLWRSSLSLNAFQRFNITTTSQSVDITSVVEDKTRFNLRDPSTGLAFPANTDAQFSGFQYQNYQVNQPFIPTIPTIQDNTRTVNFFATGSATTPFDNKYNIDFNQFGNALFGASNIITPGFQNNTNLGLNNVNADFKISPTWTNNDSLMGANPQVGYISPFLSNQNIQITSSFGNGSLSITNTISPTNPIASSCSSSVFMVHTLTERTPQGEGDIISISPTMGFRLAPGQTISGSLLSLTPDIGTFDAFRTASANLPGPVDRGPSLPDYLENLYTSERITSNVILLSTLDNGPQGANGACQISCSLFDYNLTVSGSLDTLTLNNAASIVVDSTEPLVGISNLSQLERNADALPLYNNVSDNNLNSIYSDVDYTQGGLIPTNFLACLDGTANKVQTPDSNYTQLTRILPRYNGVRLTALHVNRYSPPGTQFLNGITTETWGGDVSFGELPLLESTKPNFSYFDLLVGTSPEMEDATQVKINYIIDKEGRAFKPLNGTPAFYNVEGTYETNNIVDVSLQNSLQQDDASLTNAAVGINLDAFNTSSRVIRGARRIDPIATNQILSIRDTGSIASAFSDLLYFTNPFQESIDYRLLASDASSSAGSEIFFGTQTIQFQQLSVDPSNGYNTLDNTFEFNFQPVTGNTIKFYLEGTMTVTLDPDPGITQIVPNAVTLQLLRTSPTLGLTNEVVHSVQYSFDPQDFSFTTPSTTGVIGLSAKSQLFDTREIPLPITLVNGNFQRHVPFESPAIDCFDGDTFQARIIALQGNSGNNYTTFKATLPEQFRFRIRPQASTVSTLNNTLEDFWTTGSNIDNYLTSSVSMSFFYGNAVYVPPTQSDGSPSTFKPTNEIFSIQVGDQFRFEGVENQVFTVIEDGRISEEPTLSGSILVRVDPPIPTNIELNNFLIRRFNQDGSSVIIDLIPPSSSFSTTKGYLKNTFINQELEESINTILADLVEKGVIPSGG